MRDFLYSEIANFYGKPNIPNDPDLAIATGRRLCEEILQPLQTTFGRIAIRSGYRSTDVTAFGNAQGHGASIEANAAYHIWDMSDHKGRVGAAACIVIPWFSEQYAKGADWRSLHGGFMTTYLTHTCNSIPSSAPSTYSGGRKAALELIALSLLAVC